MTGRRLLPVVVAMLVGQGCANAPPAANLDDLRAEIRARSEGLAAAEKAGDWEGAAGYFAADAVVQPANAPQRVGRDAILELYRAFPPVADFQGTITEILPAASGDMAYEYGVNRFEFDTPGGRVESLGKYLVVWRKIDGEWRVGAIAFSDDAPQPAAVEPDR